MQENKDEWREKKLGQLALHMLASHAHTATMAVAMAIMSLLRFVWHEWRRRWRRWQRIIIIIICTLNGRSQMIHLLTTVIIIIIVIYSIVVYRWWKACCKRHKTNIVYWLSLCVRRQRCDMRGAFGLVPIAHRSPSLIDRCWHSGTIESMLRCWYCCTKAIFSYWCIWAR